MSTDGSPQRFLENGAGLLLAAGMRSGGKIDGLQTPAGALTRNPGASLHHQISSVLRSGIVSGRYADDSPLPGEPSLMTMFGVSRATVRRALRTLETDGLIERHQGRRTRVRTPRTGAGGHIFEQHIHRIEQAAAQTDVVVLAFEQVLPPHEVAQALGIAKGVSCLRITRVRTHAGTPVRYLVNYVPRDTGDRMRREDFASATMVTVLKRLGQPPGRFDDEVSAILADPDIASALDVRIGAPLVVMSRTMLRQGRPVAFQWTVIPPDRGKLRTSLEVPD